MEKIFTLKFNLFNDSIEKSVRKGEYSYWLELLFDNESYKVAFNDYYEDNCHCTKKIEVDVPATGKVTLGCIFHFTSSSSTYHYILPRQVIDINVNNEYTLNMYYYRYDSKDAVTYNCNTIYGYIPEAEKSFEAVKKPGVKLLELSGWNGEYLVCACYGGKDDYYSVVNIKTGKEVIMPQK